MSKRFTRPPAVNMLLAIPPDIRTWIEEKAALNLSPMNSVVVATLRGAMDAERQEAARAGRKTEAAV
jgi:hypothetical protein